MTKHSAPDEEMELRRLLNRVMTEPMRPVFDRFEGVDARLVTLSKALENTQVVLSGVPDLVEGRSKTILSRLVTVAEGVENCDQHQQDIIQQLNDLRADQDRLSVSMQETGAALTHLPDAIEGAVKTLGDRLTVLAEHAASAENQQHQAIISQDTRHKHLVNDISCHVNALKESFSAEGLSVLCEFSQSIRQEIRQQAESMGSEISQIIEVAVADIRVDLLRQFLILKILSMVLIFGLAGLATSVVLSLIH